MFKYLFFIFLLFSLFYCWGFEGHNIVAFISYHHLSDITKNHINNILSSLSTRNYIDIYPFIKDKEYIDNKLELYSISSWPDYLKRISTETIQEKFNLESFKSYIFKNKSYSLYNITYNLHFENMGKDSTCNNDFIDYCKSQSSIPIEFPCTISCISDAIIYYKNLLENAKDLYSIELALIYLVHLVGDIHQPFHCGYVDDRGGNKAYAYYPLDNTCYNIHWMWDTTFIHNDIKKSNKSWKEYANENILQSSKHYYNIINRTIINTHNWVSETKKYLQEENIQNNKHTSLPYSLLNNSINICSLKPYNKKLDYGSVTNEYEEWAILIIKKQLSIAASRLALILNSILDKSYKLPKNKGISTLRKYIEQIKLSKRIKDEL